MSATGSSQLGPNPANVWPTSNFGLSCRFRPTSADLDGIWPSVAQLCAFSVEIAPVWAKFWSPLIGVGPRWSKIGPYLAEFGRVSTYLAKLWPIVGEHDRARPELGQLCPGYGRMSAISTGVGASWATF